MGADELTSGLPLVRESARSRAEKRRGLLAALCMMDRLGLPVGEQGDMLAALGFDPWEQQQLDAAAADRLEARREKKRGRPAA